jgi:hypothetical protein
VNRDELINSLIQIEFKVSPRDPNTFAKIKNDGKNIEVIKLNPENLNLEFKLCLYDEETETFKTFGSDLTFIKLFEQIKNLNPEAYLKLFIIDMFKELLIAALKEIKQDA